MYRFITILSKIFLAVLQKKQSLMAENESIPVPAQVWQRRKWRTEKGKKSKAAGALDGNPGVGRVERKAKKSKAAGALEGNSGVGRVERKAKKRKAAGALEGNSRVERVKRKAECKLYS